MNEVNCFIKEKIIIENKEFYRIQEIESTEEHFVPSNQIDFLDPIILDKSYTFLKEFNKGHQRTYLSIIHPKYKIGEEVIFEIIEEELNNDQVYFKLASEYGKLSVNAFNGQEGLKYIKCKIIGYKRGRPVLRNIDTTNQDWKINELKLFEIINFGNFTDNKGNKVDSLILKTDTNLELNVRACNWHRQNLWQHNDVKCKVVGILKSGLPKLVVFDNRHPVYEIGKTYLFKINGFFDKPSYKSDSIFKIIDLIDSLGDSYEVLALPNQENKLSIGEEIECEVSDINTKVYLKQVNSGDPFYYDFKEIISEEKLQKKYFDNYLNSNDEYNLKLKSQYDQKSGFWVLTYCNFILTKIKSDASDRNDLVSVVEIITLHTKIEKWILSKGILKAINNEIERKLIKNKILQIIENNESELLAIKSIIGFEENEFYETQIQKANFKEIYYFIKYSNFHSIDEIRFLNFLYKISIPEIDSVNYYFIGRLATLIDKSTQSLKVNLQQDYFILSNNIKTDKIKSISKYINWLYIQLSLTKLINLRAETNLILSKFYRFNTFLNDDVEINQKLLLNAFYIISNTEKVFNAPVSIIENKVKVRFDELEDNPNGNGSIDLSIPLYKARAIEKHYRGYKLLLGETSGFLPAQNITDLALKNYSPETVSWETNINITLYCSKFNYFVAKQLPQDSDEYFSINKLEKKTSKIGDVIIGIVKDITLYGVFFSTNYGDGLLHVSKIGYSMFEKTDLSTMFKKGKKVPLYVLNNIENKLTFSLVDLIGTDYEKEYFDIIQFYETSNVHESNDEDTNFSFKIELEKGFIFEQFATVQNHIEEKIKYIKFAKAFFSNTKNARSYLLNIYIEYFNSIIKLDDLISNYSFKKYTEFRNDIILIKEKVQPKTLEEYPESKNLLFFIDILYLFNSKNDNDIEVLFNLIKKPIEENDAMLKAVAKNALANNLIISEITDSSDESLDSFTLKNLKRIREYISQGVLSVRETFEDKLGKELNEKRIYWREMINQDEGEKLEFKATFITPIPSNETARIIKNLENKLKLLHDEDSKKKIQSQIDEITKQSKNINGIDKIIIHSALKTICAFANTNGGHLLLGVSDDKRIFGLEQDYNSFKKDKNRDEFGKYFDSILKDYFGDSFSSSLLEKEFLKFPEGDILIVKVAKSVEEVFVLKNEKGEKEESIYVRNLSSSIKLKGIELSKFLKRRFREQLIDSSF